MPFFLRESCNEFLGTDSILDQQLGDCGDWNIAGGAYSRTCFLFDDNSSSAGTVVSGPLLLSNTVTADSATIHLLPASAPGVLDLTLTIDKAGENIDAGGTVILTLDSEGSYSPVVSGDSLIITADGGVNGLQLLSSDGFASATTTLQVTAADADTGTAGLQIEVRIFGPCTTTAGQNVSFMVQNESRCGIMVDSTAPITDIDPHVAANLAVVDLATGVETASILDGPAYEGTDPIVVDTAFIADGTTINPKEQDHRPGRVDQVDREQDSGAARQPAVRPDVFVFDQHRGRTSGSHFLC